MARFRVIELSAIGLLREGIHSLYRSNRINREALYEVEHLLNRIEYMNNTYDIINKNEMFDCKFQY